MYYPKLVLVDENNDIVSMPDNQDPDMAIQTTAKSDIDQENSKVKDDKYEPDITSKGENENDKDAPLLKAPVPSVTQSGRVSQLPQYIVDNYHYIGKTDNMEYEIKLTPVKFKFY
eukprot:5342611-Ditylum_brightwellii.AAC.2